MGTTSAPQRHPAVGVLAVRGISKRRIAEEYGGSECYLGRVLNGREPASDRFKQWLSDRLGMPVDDLFLDDHQVVSEVA